MPKNERVVEGPSAPLVARGTHCSVVTCKNRYLVMGNGQNLADPETEDDPNTVGELLQSVGKFVSIQ